MPIDSDDPTLPNGDFLDEETLALMFERQYPGRLAGAQKAAAESLLTPGAIFYDGDADAACVKDNAGDVVGLVTEPQLAAVEGDSTQAQADATQALADAAGALAGATQAQTDAAQASIDAANAQSAANTAQADATQGIADAATAQAAADAAQADATTAGATASSAQQDAAQAITDAATAQAAATTAGSAAAAAQADAIQAQANAAQAVGDAAQAQTDATAAGSAAAAAQTDAAQALLDAATNAAAIAALQPGDFLMVDLPAGQNLGGGTVGTNTPAPEKLLTLTGGTQTAITGSAWALNVAGDALIVPAGAGGWYEVEGQISYDNVDGQGAAQRYADFLRVAVNGVGITRGQGAESYLRDTSNHDHSGNDCKALVQLSPGDTIGLGSSRYAGQAGPVLVVDGSVFTVKRVA